MPLPTNRSADCRYASFLAFLSLGLCASFQAVVASGLRRLPGDRGDTVLLNFLLEHSWQWLAGGGAAPAIWDPPIGFPMHGLLAHGDLLLGVAPLYWPWRALGADPESAYALWLMSVCIVNFAAMFVLLRRLFRVDAVAAGLGAWLFAFSNALFAQIVHAQLLTQFYALGAFSGAWTFFAESPRDRRGERPDSARRAITCYASCVVLQLWSGFYVGAFIALISCVAMASALARSTSRAVLAARFRAHAMSLAIAALASAVLLAPLARHYLAARAVSQRVGVGAGELRLPRLASYFYMGPDNLLYGWTDAVPPFASLPEAHEQAIGLGLLTTSVLAFVAWRRRRSEATRIGVMVFVVLFVALTGFPFGIRLWRIWYYTLPGLAAVRAVSRIGIFRMLPASIAVALFVSESRARNGRRAWAALVIALLCGVEQLRRLPTYDADHWRCEVAAIVRAVDPRFAAFHLLGDRFANFEALAVAQRSGVPTVNLEVGAFPTAWTPFDAQIRHDGRDPERTPGGGDGVSAGAGNRSGARAGDRRTGIPRRLRGPLNVRRSVPRLGRAAVLPYDRRAA